MLIKRIAFLKFSLQSLSSDLKHPSTTSSYIDGVQAQSRITPSRMSFGTHLYIRVERGIMTGTKFLV